MAQAYFGSSISKNIMKTPEGFLVCRNVPIARTGTQKYLGSEIGLDDRPNDIITVYRTEDEVFNPKVYASFEGKPFVDEHPQCWIDSGNVQTFCKGTVTNVRRGSGADSNLLLSDIIVYSRDQVDEIMNRQKREISCGYECRYEPYKDGYKQVDISGNHVALVMNGRAGSKVAIRDNKSISNERGQTKMDGYKLPRKSSVRDFLVGVGVKHFAMDATPEDVADAVEELAQEKIAEQKDTTPVEQVKEINKDEDEIESVKREIDALKDTIDALIAEQDACDDDDVRIEEVEEEDEDEGLEKLDEFIEKKEASDDEVEEIESVEKSPEIIEEEMKEEDEEQDEIDRAKETQDSIYELAKVLRPIVASIPDSKKRRKIADSLTKVLDKQRKQVVDSAKNENYVKLVNRTSDSNVEIDKGMEIAKKFNPHYRNK